MILLSQQRSRDRVAQLAIFVSQVNYELCHERFKKESVPFFGMLIEAWLGKIWLTSLLDTFNEIKVCYLRLSPPPTVFFVAIPILLEQGPIR